MRTYVGLIVVAAFSLLPDSGNAQGVELPPPAYQRMSQGGETWAARGGFAWGPGWAGYPPLAPYGGFYGGFGGFAGSWRQRPYPYHLDYYRYRWGGGPPSPATAPCPWPDQIIEDAAPTVVSPPPQ